MWLLKKRLVATKKSVFYFLEIAVVYMVVNEMAVPWITSDCISNFQQVNVFSQVVHSHTLRV